MSTGKSPSSLSPQPSGKQNITEEEEVSVCLRRISDRMDSESVKFTYVPDNAGEISDAIYRQDE